MLKIIIIALSLIASLASFPVVSKTIEISRNAPDSAPTGIIENSFLFEDGVVYIGGTMNMALLANFTNLDASKIHTVVFNSNGGLTKVASGIAEIIHENDIETMISESSRCYSACTLMFQAGSVRTVHYTAYLMYHEITIVGPDGVGRIPTFAGTMTFYLKLIKYGLPPHIAYQITPGYDIYVSAPSSLMMGISTNMIIDGSVQE